MDGERGGAGGGGGGGVLGLEDELIVAGHQDDALGDAVGVEVADPLQGAVLEDEDAAGGGCGEFGERQLPREGQLEVGVGTAADGDVGES